ncbi:MAG: cyclic nucleotide-binding protein [Frankiales bacterium]|nr:cyclic nucleotide-binding protein [Frankiales bacterium]
MRFTQPDPRLKQLRSIHVLSGLTSSELATVAHLTTAASFRAGQQLCVQGRVGDQVFIVLEGRVGIGRDGVAVAVVGEGSLVGEMALLESTPRTATATALSDVVALVMTPREFSQLLHDHPGVAERIREVGESRRRELGAA